MRAEIISTGTELLLGEIINTNTSFIAAQLPALGIDVHFMATVGDNRQRIIEVIDQAWQRSNIIITTGGLGPTQGDITRDAIAEFLHEEITIDPVLIQNLKDRFKKYNIEMPSNNLRQAGIIPSAQSLPNSRGTAPGWWIERDNHIIITLPGPSGEVENMWKKEVYPRLEKKSGSSVLVTRTLKTFGLSEGDVDQRVNRFMSEANPTLAIYARPDGIQLRIAAKSASKESAETLIAKRESEIKQLIGQYVWGTDKDTIDSVISELLISKKLTLATMETETGGLLTQTITNLQNSHKFYKGGTVIFAADIKKYIDVDDTFISHHDTMNKETALKMASHMRKLMSSRIGIGITGVPGPDEIGGVAVGNIFIGIDFEGTLSTFSRRFPGQPSKLSSERLHLHFSS